MFGCCALFLAINAIPEVVVPLKHYWTLRCAVQALHLAPPVLQNSMEFAGSRLSLNL